MIWPTHITAVTFPVVKQVPTCTAWWTEACVWTTCPRQCPGLVSNLQHQGYKFGTLVLDYQATYSECIAHTHELINLRSLYNLLVAVSAYESVRRQCCSSFI